MFAPPSMAPLPPHDAAFRHVGAVHPSGRDDDEGFSGLQRRRSNSFSWRHAAGLPPPPSQIDQFPDVQRIMVRSPSPPQEQPRLTHSGSFTDLGLHATEPMPMHAVTKHPKLKLKVVLSSGVFEAGGTVSGALELTTSTSQRLRLGEIAVELEAFEGAGEGRAIVAGESLLLTQPFSLATELSSRDHAATQIFLFNRMLFQSEHLPPSNAVLPAAPIQGHWTARKGRTTFPFSFKLPATAPSSVQFGGHAKLRYALKGTVQTWWNESKSLVTVRSDAFVVERWHDELDPRYLVPVEAIADTHIFMGGTGAVWLEAGVAEQLFVAGGMCLVRAGIKNNTKRHLSGLKVLIAHRLTLPTPGPPGQPAQHQSLEPQITEIVHTQHFKGPSYEFPPQEEIVVNLAVNLPRELRTIRKTRLFEVQTLAVVSLDMGTFAKDLTVEVPFYVAHPASLQRTAASGLQPLQNVPQRSRSAMSQHGQHHQAATTPLANPYHRPALMSPAPMLLEPGRGYTPVPQQTPSRPSSAAPMVALPSLALPMASSPGGAAAEQVYWDPSAQRWTANNLLCPTSPNVLPRPASAQEVYRNSMATSVAQEMPRPNSAQMRPALGLNARREPGAESRHTLRAEPKRHASAPVAGEAGIAPPVSSYLAPSPTARGAPTNSLHDQQELQSAASQNAPREQATSPSAQQSQLAPSPSQLMALYGEPAAGLATIQEDSESNVGTLRGTQNVNSVSRNDIDQFERMAQRVEDEEESHKAMQAMGMIPDEMAMRRPLVVKTLPKEPKSGKESRGNTSQRKPAVRDMFNAPPAAAAGATQANLTHATTSSGEEDRAAASKQPHRPPSAQGVGLTALESRLHSPPTSTKNGPSTSNTSNKDPSNTSVEQSSPLDKEAKQSHGRRHSSQTIATSALRAAATAAADRERRAREDEEARLRDLEERKVSEARKAARRSQLAQARERDEHNLQGPPTAKDEAGGHAVSQTLLGARKHVDVAEQRKLNQEAVGRVAGWLSTSPNHSTTDVAASVTLDPALSPKTPSPSVLMDRADDDRQDATVTQSIGGAREKAKGADSKDDAIKQGELKTTSRAHKQSTATPVGAAETSRNERLSGQSQEPTQLQKSNDAKYDTEAYDAKSLRGGRGGRVASVATMWASIADGTDGSKLKDSDPVVTLKPKALRSGAATALDFSQSAASEVSADGKAGEAAATTDPSLAAVPNASKRAKEAAAALEKAAAEKKVASAPLLFKNRVRSPAAKSGNAPHFINTTMPRPIFASKDVNQGADKEDSAAPAAAEGSSMPPALKKLTQGAEEERQRPAPDGKLKASRKITSDLVAAEARLHAGMRARGLTLEGCEEEGEGGALPMNGRGTTKPIGREKLADLRSLWGG